MTSVASDEHSSIQTRPSLLKRLTTGGDSQSWQEFYRVYGKIVRDFAIQAGLSDAEADDVVQETAIAMVRHLPEYRYEPKVCRFKTWLLNQASWRIKDQIKKRQRAAALPIEASGNATPRVRPATNDTGRTATINRVPDPRAPNLDALFEGEWRKNLLSAALERLKEKFTLKQFQIFDLFALQEWPAAEVARSLGVSMPHVYMTKHRLAAALKKEIKRLEKQIEHSIRHDQRLSAPHPLSAPS